MISSSTFILTMFLTALFVATLVVVILKVGDQRNAAEHAALVEAYDVITLLHAQLMHPSASAESTLAQREADAQVRRQIEFAAAQAAEEFVPDAYNPLDPAAAPPPIDRPELRDLAQQM